ncbi:type VII secretion protein EccB [Corynebacterium sp. HMSC22B11]|uniref:type VII secretion protein EccB n=1 Tax=Corynebacterium sp. HMSC22B11 TaxID=1581056 RepID=UPI0008A49F7D|nr:type VII secretion protein EccB [Corynebacterium sp. HMSC22B11]OFO15818.1 type VII secretion protein EccB [Corynebacterium sp. HMSC22B11]
MRTTSLQVSGYRFLLRRLELALVIGDPRMAHDPLRAQRRSIGVGFLVSALIAGGAVMLSLLRPAPSIDDAALVADEQGSLHVRLEDGFHPVSNVASARLMLRQPVEVKNSTAALIQEGNGGAPMGPAVGIGHVPGLNPAPVQQWLVCDTSEAAGKPDTLQVRAVEEVESYQRGVVRSGKAVWLIDGTKRSLAEGGAARALGAVEISMAPELLNRFDEQGDSLIPRGLSGLKKPFHRAGTVAHAGDRAFLVGRGGVSEVTGPRREYVEALAPGGSFDAELGAVMAQPMIDLLPNVPDREASWAHPEQSCLGEKGLAEPAGDGDGDGDGKRTGAGDGAAGGEAGGEADGSAGGAGTESKDDAAGQDPRAAYAGPAGTSALLTERGFFLVDATGTRFTVGKAEDLTALGFTEHTQVPWRVISGLPEGGVLSEANARATSTSTKATANTAESANGTR